MHLLDLRPIDRTVLFWGKRVDKKELDLPWGERKKTYNSRLAQELGKWAETKGKGDEYHDAVFRAYFVDGNNIAETEERINHVSF